MNESRVIHFEDNMAVRGVLETGVTLASDGAHNVVGHAATVDEAKLLLDRIDRGEFDADVLLLDDDLSGGFFSGYDAREVLNHIHKLDLPLRVIGLGDQALSIYGIEVDAEFEKHHLSLPLLVAALDALPDPR